MSSQTQVTVYFVQHYRHKNRGRPIILYYLESYSQISTMTTFINQFYKRLKHQNI